MKIGIESQRIFRRGKHGMDVVALELMRQIQLIDKRNEYLLFARNDDDRNCLADTENFKTVILNGITYAGWEQLALPAAVRKFKPRLLHCTANTAPYSCAVPLVVTVHDIIYLEEVSFEGSAYQNFGNIYRRLVVPHAIKISDRVITVSEYEKTVITRVCKTDPEKIEVIYNGVSERFHRNFSEEQIDTFRKQLQLPPAFLLFLGNKAPKKNTAGMIKAYMHYCSMVDDPWPLVITDLPAASVKAFLEKLNRPELISRIITTGYVPSDLMPLMYNCSSLFLYPSLRESFGLPILEAMSCGVPVITSDLPAIREVAGQAAILTDPENPMTIAEAINDLSIDKVKRNLLIEKGIAQAKKFSWENSAKKLISLYETF